MADRIKVLRYGAEVEEAETNAMLSAPREDYTKSLWSVRALDKPETPSDDIVLAIRNVDAAYGVSLKVLKQCINQASAWSYRRHCWRVRFRKIDNSTCDHRPAATANGQHRI